MILLLFTVAVNLNWVEVDVGLDPRGGAQFVYKIKWTVESGTLHGFYLEGLSIDPVYFDQEESFAEDDYGRKYRLEIKKIGSKKYDVVLARGQGVSRGSIIYTVICAGNLYQSGNLDRTKSPYGELVVLNWAPPQWEYPMEHQTVYVHYPIDPGSDLISPEIIDQIGFRTERFMNEKYKLFYETTYYQNRRYFTVGIHKQGLYPEEKMQIQQYVPARYFTLKKPSPLKRLIPNLDLFIYLISTMISFLIYSYRKTKGISRARRELPKIRWLRSEWVPPKIQAASLRKTGKVAKLDLAEAALLLDFPIGTVLSMILLALEKNNKVTVNSYQPIRLQINDKSGLKYYEQGLLATIEPTGEINQDAVKVLIRNMVDRISQKAWDCDLEATRSHYVPIVRDFLASLEEEDYYDYLDREKIEPGYYGRSRYYYFRDNIIAEPATVRTYSTFIRSDACHSACYVHTACHDAC
ncbi:MAG TPA: hypothetical protein EYP58_02170, partial [bacterium (Candidatus Stahlbacteria)]|nr:hypothetical protein [Candidatus Stahlbacteria bacterium]